MERFVLGLIGLEVVWLSLKAAKTLEALEDLIRKMGALELKQKWLLEGVDRIKEWTADLMDKAEEQSRSTGAEMEVMETMLKENTARLDDLMEAVLPDVPREEIWEGDE